MLPTTIAHVLYDKTLTTSPKHWFNQLCPKVNVLLADMLILYVSVMVTEVFIQFNERVLSFMFFAQNYLNIETMKIMNPNCRLWMVGTHARSYCSSLYGSFWAGWRRGIFKILLKCI